MAPPFDFRRLERELHPTWEAHHRLGPSAWSVVPGGPPCVYGAADAIIGRAVLHRLGPPGERAALAAAIHAAQDPETGWYRRRHHRAHAREHTAAYAVAALHLLGERPRHPLLFLAPLASPAGRERWIRGAPWTLFWPGSHVVAGPPAILDMTGAEPPGFFDWYLGWLDREADPATGFWRRGLQHRLGLQRRPTRHDLGGAFHLYAVYAARRRPWRYPERVVDATLALQRPSGLWARRHTYCLDLDGVYSLVRSSTLAGGYRQADVQAAITRYLAAAERQLNDPDLLARRYSDSHVLPGALAAVAECQRAFPDLIRTERPWVQTLDHACFI